MDQPVSIRIEFPRSGQQLRITVPQHIAQAIMDHHPEDVIAVFEGHRTNGCTGHREDFRA